MYDQLCPYFNKIFSKLLFFHKVYNVAQVLNNQRLKNERVIDNFYHLYFLRISKVWSMLPITVCFCHIHFFFGRSMKLWRQNINHSETRIGDTKLSVKLHELGKALYDCIGNI